MKALIGMLLHIHRGSVDEIGSLSYWFAIMDKKRLDSKKPDYHTLFQALEQILDGIILDAWRRKCDLYDSLSDFARSQPPASLLLDCADEIIEECTDQIDDSTADTSPNVDKKGEEVSYTASSPVPFRH
jgi:hypothetical protein